jgi:large subunit ribosomal protein L24
MIEKKKLKMKKGDLVKVISGDQKGLVGKIISINFKKLGAILENAKTRKKLLKDKDKEENQKDLAIPIHLSNLMLWEEELKQVSRIGIKVIDGKKQRYYKKSTNLIN